MTIAARTSESAASFPRRLAAGALDALLLGLLVQALQWGAWFGFGLGAGTLTGAWSWHLYLLATVSLPCGLYYLLGDASAGGATPGKRWLGVRVLHVYGSRVSLPRALVRTLFKLLPWELAHVALCFPEPVFVTGELPMPRLLMAVYGLVALYLAAALMTLKKQSVHDLAVGTWVVRAGARGGAIAA